MYYLGIDGGGTKTAFALADEKGRVLRQLVLGPSNPLDIGWHAAMSCLETGIRQTLEEISPKEVCMFAGIAGGISGDSRERIADFLSSFGFAFFDNGSDAQNTVAAGLGKQKGVVVIMGTGSVAFVQTGESLVRLGGYGYLFETGGSGYAVGRDAIVAALAYEEQSGAPTCLYTMLLEQLKVPSLTLALGELYAGGKKQISSYAPLVFAAYQKGDKIAEDILRRNMAAVAQNLEIARRRLPGEHKIRVVLAGGMTARADVLIPLIKEKLTCPETYDIEVLDRQNVKGALLLSGMPTQEDMYD